MQLYHIVLNNLRRRKAKMFFVLLGLVIGIATMVSVYGVVETMKTEMTKQVSEFGVNVVITPDAGGLTFSYGGITLPEIMYDVEQLTSEDVISIEKLESREMIRVIAPKLLGVESLENGQKAIIVGANLQDEFLVKPWLRIQNEESMAVDVAEMVTEDGTKMEFDAIDLTRQDLENLNILDHQVIMGSSLAESLNIKLGDTLLIAGQELEVYALLLESGSSEDQQIFMNLSAAQELLGRSNEITTIEMAVDYLQGSEETLLAEINEALPHAYVTSLRQETLRRDEMLMRLVRFGMSISVLVLLVGMLVVGLTMLSAVRERTREIGVFRALGFRKAIIAKMIVMEGVIISIAGGFIGYFLGMYMARFAGPFLAGMDIQVPWRIDILFMAIGIAILIGLISSLYPASQAAKQDPVEALRFI
jgi:putative ABC transport system permease protein